MELFAKPAPLEAGRLDAGWKCLTCKELEPKEGRAGSPSRPFLRDEPMNREKKAA